MARTSTRQPVRVRRRPSAARRAQIRRRRFGAVAILALVILGTVLVAATGGGSGASPGTAARSRRSSPRLQARSRAGRTTLQTRENAAINRLLARQPLLTAGGRERREIALTFDDGPGPYTPRVLDELQRLRVPATFFTVGSMIHYFYDSLRREVRLGAVVGDHTELHSMMGLLSPAAQRAQITVQTQQMRRYGASFPRLYRPPYGSFNRATFAILRRLHMLMVLWTVDSQDYRRPGVVAIVSRVLAGAKPGAIILMHDAGGERSQTIAALPRVVRALQARGYRLVTVPRLVLDDPPRRPQGPPRSLAGD